MKIVMIGSYAHAVHVLNGLAGLKDVQVVAASPYGPDDSLAFIGKHPATPAGLPVYDDYRKMLDDVRPDVASVYVPMHRIAETCTAAVERGCHVIAEKPLATELADLEALRRAAAKAGVQVIAGLGMRGAPPFQAIRQAVADGRIGRPVLAFGQKSYPFAGRDAVYASRKTYGGSIPWQAIHALDFVAYCAGKDYVRAAAMHANVGHPSHPGMEDTGGILLEFAGGGHAIISFDYFRPFDKSVKRAWGDERLRLAGTEGVLELVDEGKQAELLTPTAQQRLPLPPKRDFVAEFIEHLRDGRPCLMTMAESFRLTEVALKARLAADTGEIVDLTH